MLKRRPKKVIDNIKQTCKPAMRGNCFPFINFLLVQFNVSVTFGVSCGCHIKSRFEIHYPTTFLRFFPHLKILDWTIKSPTHNLSGGERVQKIKIVCKV